LDHLSSSLVEVSVRTWKSGHAAESHWHRRLLRARRQSLKIFSGHLFGGTARHEISPSGVSYITGEIADWAIAFSKRRPVEPL
jgi:hypothetical protein